MGADEDIEITAALGTDAFAAEFDEHYGLIQPVQTVLVRAYGEDEDDQMLEEIKPRFIVMFEPNLDFVRRVEVRYSTKFLTIVNSSKRRCTGARTLAWLCESTSWFTS